MDLAALQQFMAEQQRVNATLMAELQSLKQGVRQGSPVGSHHSSSSSSNGSDLESVPNWAHLPSKKCSARTPAGMRLAADLNVRVEKERLGALMEAVPDFAQIPNVPVGGKNAQLVKLQTLIRQAMCMAVQALEEDTEDGTRTAVATQAALLKAAFDEMTQVRRLDAARGQWHLLERTADAESLFSKQELARGVGRRRNPKHDNFRTTWGNRPKGRRFGSANKGSSAKPRYFSGGKGRGRGGRPERTEA